MSDDAGYRAQCCKRRRLLEPDTAALEARTYSIDCQLNLPHQAAVHALALSPNHIYSAGSDGFIRRYSVYESLNGTNSPRNLIARRETSIKSPAHLPVLLSYWENSDPDASNTQEERVGKAKYGTRSIHHTNFQASPVHSLAVDKEEMFTLAGSENGHINLFSVRFDEGHVRHSFAPETVTNGHQAMPISVLRLCEQDTNLISGGWDSNVVQWDLNTGQLVRTYDGAYSHLSSLSFRPLTTLASSDWNDMDIDEAAIAEKPSKRVRTDESQVDASQHQLTAPTSNPDSSVDRRKSMDSLFGEEDAEGSDAEGSGTEAVAAALGVPASTAAPFKMTLPSGKAPPKLRPALANALDSTLPAQSNNILLGSCIDGQVLLWDRRTKGLARAFERGYKVPPWATQASWSNDGTQVLVGRRNERIDVYDLRGASDSSITMHLPAESGPVYAVQPMPNSRHLLIGSRTTLRLWDTQAMDSSKVPFQVVPSLYNGPLSALAMDDQARYLVAAVGSRGWESEANTDGAFLYACKSVPPQAE